MSMLQRQVREFHETFGMPLGQDADGIVRPHVLSDERMRLRLRLIAEEFMELMVATGVTLKEDIAPCLADLDERFREIDLQKVDLVEFVDAIADLDYVVEGCRVEMGIDGGPIADEVHRSNLSKVGAPKRADGKQTKGENYSPPDIAGELKRQGWSP